MPIPTCSKCGGRFQATEEQYFVLSEDGEGFVSCGYDTHWIFYCENDHEPKPEELDALIKLPVLG